MNLKLRMGLCCALGILALFSGGYAASMPTRATAAGSQTQPAAIPPAAFVSTAEQNRPGYLLRDCGGYIGIYRAENPGLLVELTAIEVVTLRKVDRDLLNQGIYCRTERELYSLLEDFGS